MSTPASKIKRFTQIELVNWRNFAQSRVNLQRRVFIVGPNESGKSNLLDAFRFLHDLVSVGGGFQEAVTRRGGVGRLRSLVGSPHADVAIRVRLGDGEGAASWGYGLCFNEHRRQHPVVKEER